MVDLVYYLANLFFFDIPLLYYYINPRSSIPSSCAFVTVSELFRCEVF